MRVNKLGHNPDRAEVLLLALDAALGNCYTLMHDKVALLLTDEVHSLAVLLDPALLLHKLVVAVARSTFHQQL